MKVSDIKEIANWWDFQRNDTDPRFVSLKTRRKYWFHCPLGHSFLHMPYNWNSRQEPSCPYCSYRTLLMGFNDVYTVAPSLLRYWDNDNNMLSPKSSLAAATKKYWWKCDKGHSFVMSIGDILNKDRWCPFCSHRTLLSGFNDFATIYPKLLKDWDYDRNSISPSEIMPGSSRTVWWKCSHCGSSYSSELYRKIEGRGCPYCAGKKVNVTNSLLDNYPEIAATFSDSSHNGTIYPYMISYGSSKEFWWDCPNGHVYRKTVKARVHGSDCPYCAKSNTSLLTGFNDVSHLFPALLKDWDYSKNKIAPDKIVAGSGKRAYWKCHICQHTWKQNIYNRTYGGHCCPSCAYHHSKPEQQVASYIRTILPSKHIITNTRTIIPPKELDIYIPSKKIAIEFNGLYWHGYHHLSQTFSKTSDARLYHYNKWLRCQQKGIQLITIWEDDWRDRQDIVKSMLAYKMGLSDERRVFARRTSVMAIDGHESSEFLDRYHIQGAVRGSLRYGLYDDRHVLVAVGVFRRRNDGSVELSRYATSCSVVGGMGKILHRFHDDNPDVHRVITFADHTVSDGAMYERLGFVVDGELKPDYMYVVNGIRVHKFNYRLKRFRDDPALKYDADMSESGLALMNGLDRVYDAGKTRWMLDI